MNGHRTFGAALVALCALAAPAGAQTVHASGPPDGGAGWMIADGTRSADDFLLAHTIAFDAVRFWVILPTGATYAPTMFWEILADASGLPAATSLFGGLASTTATWRGTSATAGFDSWQLDMHVGARSLGAGHYWLALHDGPVDGVTFSSLIWETTAASGDTFAVEDFGVWTGDWDGALAFELRSTTTAPEPATAALLASGLAALIVTRRRQRRTELPRG